jgi:transcriptional regulator with XRE-family HTH domain
LHKQHALAHSLGVNQSTITRWKQDGPMSLESAAELCRTLDISMDWLVRGIGVMEQHRLDGSEMRAAGEKLTGLSPDAPDKLSQKSKTLLASFIDSVLP